MNDNSTPKPRLRVLLIEDSEDDAFLLIRTLRQGGYELVSERVETAPALRAALDEQRWDIVFCDYVMPEFSGPAAVEQIRACDPDVPVIMVSGEVREEVLVTAMKAGANDYVLKDRLARLLPAVSRERAEAEARVARRRAAAELRRSQELWRQLFEQSPVGLVVTDTAGQVTNLNAAALAMLGSPGEEASCRFNVLTLPALQRERRHQAYARVLAGGPPERAEGPYRSAHGRETQLDFHLVPLRDGDGGVVGTLSILQDLTERRQVERALRTSEEAQRSSRERFRALIESSHDMIGLVDADGRALYVSAGSRHVMGREPHELVGTLFIDHIHPDDHPHAGLEDVLAQPGATILRRLRLRHADGSWRWIDGSARNLLDHPDVAAIVLNARALPSEG